MILKVKTADILVTITDEDIANKVDSILEKAIEVLSE